MQYLQAIGSIMIAMLLAGCTVPGTSTNRQQPDNSVTDDGTNEATGNTVPAWMESSYYDVEANKTKTIASMEKPILVESFAVWCSTCTRQQIEIKDMNEQDAVEHTSLSLNTDPEEGPTAVRQHMKENGFDWTYGIASAALVNDLLEAFGPTIITAPQVPKILVCSNTSFRRLQNGVRTASTLTEDIRQGC